MDKISKERRSWNMSRIKGKDTQPELIVRSSLHKLGFRFRLHCIDLPGTPDIVLPRYKTVIFVHGCYWHRHMGCRLAYTPKTRLDFWTRKFDMNVDRDNRISANLTSLNWKVGVIWECETKDQELLILQIRTILGRKYPIGGDIGNSNN